MDWRALSPGVWESQGYRIAAVKLNGEWGYCAFAPPLTDVEFESRLKAYYGPGECVPQRRAHLGCYPEPETAREVCAGQFLAVTK